MLVLGAVTVLNVRPWRGGQWAPQQLYIQSASLYSAPTLSMTVSRWVI
jgi:hypothetical protein